MKIPELCVLGKKQQPQRAPFLLVTQAGLCL